MKLSEIKGVRVFDVIAEIVDPIANIASSDAMQGILNRVDVEEGDTPVKILAKRIKGNLPTLIKNHREDVITIIASINNVSVKEYLMSMTMTTLIKDIVELLSDDELMELFTSAQSVDTDEPLRSVQETTTAEA